MSHPTSHPTPETRTKREMRKMRAMSSTTPWSTLFGLATMFATATAATGCLDLIGYRDHVVGDPFGTGGGGGETGGGGTGGIGGTGGTGGTGGSSGECDPGLTRACYSGPTETENVGQCAPGIEACGPDGMWGECIGEVLPGTEDCSIAGDEDCNFGGVGCSEAVWSKIFGDASRQTITDIAVDGQGNVYLFGTFGGSVAFGGDTFISLGREVFLAKLDPKGQHLWSKHWGDGHPKTYTGEVVVDSSGSVIISGGFQGTIDFGTGPMTFAGGGIDSYIAKFETDGDVVWAKHFVDGGVGTLGVDSQGDVVAAGVFNGSVDFGEGSVLDAATGNLYLVKLLSATGLSVWAKNFASVNGSFLALEVDPIDNILLAGGFSESLKLNTTEFVATEPEVFLARFTPQGQGGWVRHFPAGFVVRGDLAVSSTGGVLLMFATDTAVDMGDGELSPMGLTDIVLGKYNSAGILEWGQRWGGPGTDTDPRVEFDKLDRPLIASSSEDAFNYGEGLSLPGTGSDVTVVQLDDAGVPRWARRYGDLSQQYLPSIAVGPDAEIFLGANVLGTIDFGNGPLVAADDVGDDIVIAKIAP